MKIAAVMPVYNGETFLREALDSLASQRRPPDRVIVVDDASADRSLEIAAAAGAECFSLPTNRGPSHARNRGIAEAEDCEALLFLDSDDWLDPGHVECLEKRLLDHPDCAVAFPGVRSLRQDDEGAWHPISEAPLDLPADTPLQLAETLIRNNVVPQSGTLARRQVILDVGGYDEEARFSEDYHLWCRIALDFPFVYASAVQTNYRVHAAQATSDHAKLKAGAWRTRQEIYRILETGNRPELLATASRILKTVWQRELREAVRVRNRSSFRVFVDSPAPAVGASTVMALRALAGPLWKPLMGTQWMLDTLMGRRRP